MLFLQAVEGMGVEGQRLWGQSWGLRERVQGSKEAVKSELTSRACHLAIFVGCRGHGC